MIIEAFERAADDSVVAICNGVKHILPWSFVIDNKPQVGDMLHEIEGGFALVEAKLLNIAKEVEAVFEEPSVEAPLATVEAPLETPVEPTI